LTNECVVCGSVYAEPLYDGILKCRKCGHIFANLYLSDDELFTLYRKDYFFGDEYSNYIADKKTIQKNFRLRIKILQRFLDPTHHKHLLEVGSAYGFFLDVVRNYFESVKGLDISEDGVRYARQQLNLDVIQADLLTYNLERQTFDVVCLWDTIEHLRNPHLYIQKISECTSQGALLAITTGDIASLNARFRKDKWRLLHPPTHLHYFSRSSLVRMLNNYNFETIYDRYCGFYRSIDNAAYNLFILRYRKPTLYELIKKSGLTRFDFYLNMQDIVYIIARKR
jgi:protein-L-isoaspartate O-methyltransferase